MSVLQRLTTFGQGSGQPLRYDRPPWIRQSRTLDSWGNAIQTPERALGVGAVFACVTRISLAVGSVPLVAYAKRDGEREKARETDLWDIVHERAHPTIPATRLWQIVAAHMAGWGNAYLLKIRERGRVVALWPLYPSRVTICEENGETYFDHRMPDGTLVRLSHREVLHIPYFTIDGVCGLSPIEVVRRELSAIDGESTFREGLLRNGARLSGVLTTDGELSEDAAGRVAGQWQAAHQGPSNAGSVAVLEGGMKWLPMSASPKDMEFAAQRASSVADVARWFGVPPSIVNAPAQDSLTYSTVEGEAIGFVKWCLTPGYLGPIESAINADRDLVPVGSRLSVEFMLDGLLRADSKTRAEVYEIEHRIGSLTTDEIRKKENRPELPPSEQRMSVSELTLALQKIYLSTGVVISPDEAREILNRAGADLGPTPEGLEAVARPHGSANEGGAPS